MKHRLYVDEVGNPDLKSSDNPDHRYLSLTGVIFELDYVKDVLNPELEKIKKDFFGSHPDDPIILHRKELLHKSPPFSALQNPAIEKNFNGAILKSLSDWEYTVISVLIDKKEHSERYSTWKFDPYHYCQEILAERFRLFLDIHRSHGDVMFESRGGKEDMRLKRSYRRIMENGTNHLLAENISPFFTSRELKVKPKTANISGLQIADLLAHAARRYLFQKVLNLDDGKKTFSDELIKIMEKGKFFSYKGMILGYGAKKLP